MIQTCEGRANNTQSAIHSFHWQPERKTIQNQDFLETLRHLQTCLVVMCVCAAMRDMREEMTGSPCWIQVTTVEFTHDENVFSADWNIFSRAHVFKLLQLYLLYHRSYSPRGQISVNMDTTLNVCVFCFRTNIHCCLFSVRQVRIEYCLALVLNHQQKCLILSETY